MKIVQRALRMPAQTIASNAGLSGEVVVGKTLELTNYREGFDAATGVYKDLVAAGIVDPTKVLLAAPRAVAFLWLQLVLLLHPAHLRTRCLYGLCVVS